MVNQLEQTAVAALLGLPDRLLLVVALLLVMAIPAEVACQEQEPTRLRQQTACPLLYPTTSLAQVKTLAS